ncbi:hypothetical protein H0E84_19445 [Luteimonas sp. SJ-92]|uniref:Uncharacterized protein n=1 Tax=Luteimonas salinisoli TaxID=2752307 RepID=A0A853JIM5_9GAMM|nr:hypothetical protein [Luteimonas salinisoli]NZA28552.1 hypothetical protein [Luteimonas salinisoli]
MNDLGFEFDAGAMPPASGPAEWTSAAGIDGSLAAHQREPEANAEDGGQGWRSADPRPLRPWWAPGSASGACTP